MGERERERKTSSMARKRARTNKRRRRRRRPAAGRINCSRETPKVALSRRHTNVTFVRPRKLTLSAVSRSRVCNSCYGKLCILTNGLRPSLEQLSSARHGRDYSQAGASRYFCARLLWSFPGLSKKHRYAKKILINVYSVRFTTVELRRSLRIR